VIIAVGVPISAGQLSVVGQAHFSLQGHDNCSKSLFIHRTQALAAKQYKQSKSKKLKSLAFDFGPAHLKAERNEPGFAPDNPHGW
jgi:hypothetical protein